MPDLQTSRSEDVETAMVSLTYQTPVKWPRRPLILIGIGILSISLGLFCLFANLAVIVLPLFGPFSPPDAPRPFDLGISYEVEEWLSAIAACWLFVAGILVFASSGVWAWRARRMLWVYLVAKLIFSLCYAGLMVANDLNLQGKIPATVWAEDGLFWLLMTGVYPTLLIPALRLKSVRAYYQAVLQI